MKKILKKLYYDNFIVHFILYPFISIYNFIRFSKENKISDKEYIKFKYKEKFNNEINLEQPRLFTEKIQWLKLNDHNDMYTLCADKYSVREYVRNKIGENYLIPLILVTKNYKDINSNNLPDYPVIIKTTHDSGGTFVIENKYQFNFTRLQHLLKMRLKNNFYYINREWEYKNIVPRIIVEKLLKDNSENEVLNDYKIHCFNGIPLYIQTIFDRKSGVKEDWYDIDWNPIGVYYFSAQKKGIVKPELLNELLVVAKKLSQDFPYVRVDLYIANEQIYFGELTFRPYGGFMKFIPESFDLFLGEKLKLDIKIGNRSDK